MRFDALQPPHVLHHMTNYHSRFEVLLLWTKRDLSVPCKHLPEHTQHSLNQFVRSFLPCVSCRCVAAHLSSSCNPVSNWGAPCLHLQNWDSIQLTSTNQLATTVRKGTCQGCSQWFAPRSSQKEQAARTSYLCDSVNFNVAFLKWKVLTFL